MKENDWDSERIRQQFDFLLEIDKEKEVVRRTPLHDNSRMEDAAEKLFSRLPEDQAFAFAMLFNEFNVGDSPEAQFARTLDNIQPAMLNNASEGTSWEENGIALSQVLKRNASTDEGSEILWNYAYKNFILPNVWKGHLKDDLGDRKPEEP